MHARSTYSRRPRRVVVLRGPEFNDVMAGLDARSNAEIADLLNVDRTYIHRIRAGVADPGVGLIAAIDALNVDFRSVFTNRIVDLSELGRRAA